MPQSKSTTGLRALIQTQLPVWMFGWKRVQQTLALAARHARNTLWSQGSCSLTTIWALRLEVQGWEHCPGSSLQRKVFIATSESHKQGSEQFGSLLMLLFCSMHELLPTRGLRSSIQGLTPL